MTICAPSRRKALLAEFLERVWNCGEADACDRFIAERYALHHDRGDPWEGRTLDLAGYQGAAEDFARTVSRSAF